MAIAKATHISRQRRPSSRATCAKFKSLYSFSSSGAPTMMVDPTAAPACADDASPPSFTDTLSRGSGDGGAAASIAGTAAGGAAVLLAMNPLVAALPASWDERLHDGYEAARCDSHGLARLGEGTSSGRYPGMFPHKLTTHVDLTRRTASAEHRPLQLADSACSQCCRASLYGRSQFVAGRVSGAETANAPSLPCNRRARRAKGS